MEIGPGVPDLVVWTYGGLEVGDQGPSSAGPIRAQSPSTGPADHAAEDFRNAPHTVLSGVSDCPSADTTSLSKNSSPTALKAIPLGTKSINHSQPGPNPTAPPPPHSLVLRPSELVTGDPVQVDQACPGGLQPLQQRLEQRQREPVPKAGVLLGQGS